MYVILHHSQLHKFMSFFHKPNRNFENRNLGLCEDVEIFTVAAGRFDLLPIWLLAKLFKRGGGGCCWRRVSRNRVPPGIVVERWSTLDVRNPNLGFWEVDEIFTIVASGSDPTSVEVLPKSVIWGDGGSRWLRVPPNRVPLRIVVDRRSTLDVRKSNLGCCEVADLS